ncbi:hypothetical protein VKT23_014683 [Stygiomarasmius scandens]|uniref:Uncharacterized protein n=1 Tax=Marasmiellus scandens TaxID=2682957 RepID=A0ABR1J4Q8_9AGAR
MYTSSDRLHVMFDEAARRFESQTTTRLEQLSHTSNELKLLKKLNAKSAETFHHVRIRIGELDEYVNEQLSDIELGLSSQMKLYLDCHELVIRWTRRSNEVNRKLAGSASMAVDVDALGDRLLLAYAEECNVPSMCAKEMQRRLQDTLNFVRRGTLLIDVLDSLNPHCETSQSPRKAAAYALQVSTPHPESPFEPPMMTASEALLGKELRTINEQLNAVNHRLDVFAAVGGSNHQKMQLYLLNDDGAALKKQMVYGDFSVQLEEEAASLETDITEIKEALLHPTSTRPDSKTYSLIQQMCDHTSLMDQIWLQLLSRKPFAIANSRNKMPVIFSSRTNLAIKLCNDHNELLTTIFSESSVALCSSRSLLQKVKDLPMQSPVGARNDADSSPQFSQMTRASSLPFDSDKPKEPKLLIPTTDTVVDSQPRSTLFSPVIPSSTGQFSRGNIDRMIWHSRGADTRSQTQRDIVHYQEPDESIANPTRSNSAMSSGNPFEMTSLEPATETVVDKARGVFLGMHFCLNNLFSRTWTARMFQRAMTQKDPMGNSVSFNHQLGC